MATSTTIKKKGKNIGKFYVVSFLDHCISDQHHVLLCHVAGWLIDEQDKFITLTYWKVDDEEYRESNREPVNIVTSCITSLVELPDPSLK